MRSSGPAARVAGAQGGDRPGQRRQQHQQRRGPGPARQPWDPQRVLDRRVLEAAGLERDGAHGDDQPDGREPGDRAPARRREAAGREQQEAERRHGPDPHQPDPLADPREERSRVVDGLCQAAEHVARARQEQQPADGVARPAGRHERADGGEREHEQHVGEEQPDAVAERRRHDGDEDRHGQEPDRPREPPHRSHTETWAGWTVSATTPRRSAVSDSRSTSSRRRPPNVASVRCAS